MRKSLTVLGIITARGGSKSIPNKNITSLCGKPLIVYTIEAAKKSKGLTRCIVSTDSERIAEIARERGTDVPFMRPVELAQDTSTSLEVVQHAISWLKKYESLEYDYVLILQPTSPLRTAADIDAAIRIAQETGADSVMGMKELDDMSLEKLKTIGSDGLIAPIVIEEKHISRRRQDVPRVYKRNAAIYLTKTECLKRGDLFGERSYAYVMPEERSVDINRLIDVDLAEFFLSKHT